MSMFSDDCLFTMTFLVEKTGENMVGLFFFIKNVDVNNSRMVLDYYEQYN